MNKYIPQKTKLINEYKPNEACCRIKLDANESPYLPSEKMLNEFTKAVKNTAYNRYPDPDAKEVIDEFIKVYGNGSFTSENVIAGNGSDELISVIYGSFLSKGDRVLCVTPDFSMYSFYNGIVEAKLVEYNKSSVGEIDFDAVKRLADECDASLVALSNPCNPTGIAYDRSIIEKFVRSLGRPVIIDEAYMEFCDRDCSVIDLCTELDNLIVLKTLSKLGLAALRVGFAVTNRELAAVLRKVKSPYNVNSLSQSLAACVLRNFNEFAESASKIRKDTFELYVNISKLSNSGKFTIKKPDANFIAVWFNDAADAERIFLMLAERGISVRHMPGGLLRVTCGTIEENVEFIETFEEIL